MSTAVVCSPIVDGGNLLLPDISHCFDLAQTLDCGQAFRWVAQPDGSYKGVAHGRLLHISSCNSTIVLHDTTLEEYERLWRRYFDIDRDYASLKATLAADAVLGDAIGYAPGIRVLCQDPWEAVCTFIISANNNIPRIKGIVERLCALLGDEVGEGLYSFPSPERVAALQEEQLAPLRCGYRSSYLIDAATKVASRAVDLDSIVTMPIDDARKALLGIKGIGPKVAECALLFGFGRVECFPMDTWMKKIMGTLYPCGLPERFVPVAGIAQQYLFHYARHHSDLFDEVKS